MTLQRPLGLEHERGQSLVEFALVLPTLLLIVFGILEAGRAFYAYTAVANAVREGARYAVTNATNTTAIKNVVIGNAIGVGLAASDVTVTCSPCTSGNTIRVAVTFTHRAVVASMFPSFPIDSASTMDIE
jgi:Flp pilus assembly protein TadG